MNKTIRFSQTKNMKKKCDKKSKAAKNNPPIKAPFLSAIADPNGMYTGMPSMGKEPVQDADDL